MYYAGEETHTQLEEPESKLDWGIKFSTSLGNVKSQRQQLGEPKCVVKDLLMKKLI